MRQHDAAQDERCSGERTLAQEMPECFLPRSSEARATFEPVTDELSDWMPTHEHFPRSKREGGHRDTENAVLANRLCTRIDYFLGIGRPYVRDLERVRKAREEAIRRNNERPWSPADCWRTGGCWTPTISPA